MRMKKANNRHILVRASEWKCQSACDPHRQHEVRYDSSIHPEANGRGFSVGIGRLLPSPSLLEHPVTDDVSKAKADNVHPLLALLDGLVSTWRFAEFRAISPHLLLR